MLYSSGEMKLSDCNRTVWSMKPEASSIYADKMIYVGCGAAHFCSFYMSIHMNTICCQEHST